MLFVTLIIVRASISHATPPPSVIRLRFASSDFRDKNYQPMTNVSLDWKKPFWFDSSYYHWFVYLSLSSSLSLVGFFWKGTYTKIKYMIFFKENDCFINLKIFIILCRIFNILRTRVLKSLKRGHFSGHIFIIVIKVISETIVKP